MTISASVSVICTTLHNTMETSGQLRLLTAISPTLPSKIYLFIHVFITYLCCAVVCYLITRQYIVFLRLSGWNRSWANCRNVSDVRAWYLYSPWESANLAPTLFVFVFVFLAEEPMRPDQRDCDCVSASLKLWRLGESSSVSHLSKTTDL